MECNVSSQLQRSHVGENTHSPSPYSVSSALEKRARSQPVNRLVRVVNGRRMVINTGANAFTYVEHTEPIVWHARRKP